jgi:hypothetical protein
VVDWSVDGLVGLSFGKLFSHLFGGLVCLFVGWLDC